MPIGWPDKVAAAIEEGSRGVWPAQRPSQRRHPPQQRRHFSTARDKKKIRQQGTAAIRRGVLLVLVVVIGPVARTNVQNKHQKYSCTVLFGTTTKKALSSSHLRIVILCAANLPQQPKQPVVVALPLIVVLIVMVLL
jgi:hypothetical protein